MSQKDAWEREYRNPQLVKLGENPRTDLKEYIKFLRKIEGVYPENLTILDLGSGTGKHSNYLAGMGNAVTGLEISPTAIKLAQSRAKEMGVAIKYQMKNIGELYPFRDEYFHLAIDVMSSNSLNQKEREIYLKEVHRVLQRGGHFFVRALRKDGDKNAKKLLQQSPGPEYDTYLIKDMNLIERVFSHDDFVNMYSQFFDIQRLKRKTNYARFKGQSYKRNYWLAYMKKT